MPLRRLTRFSRLELEKESEELRRTIEELDAILGDDKLLRKVVAGELDEVAKTYGTPRRTVLLESAGSAAVTAAARSRWPTTRASSTSPPAACWPARPAPTPPGTGEGRAKHDVVVSAVAQHRPRRGRRADQPRPGDQARRARPARAAALGQRPAPRRRAPGQRGAPPGGRRAAAGADRARPPTGRASRSAPVTAWSSGSTRRSSTATTGRSSRSRTATRSSARSSWPPATRRSASSPPTPSCCTTRADNVRPQGRSGGGIAGVRVTSGERALWFGALGARRTRSWSPPPGRPPRCPAPSPARSR